MPTILVIEDSPDVLANITEILELDNYEVLNAKDGLEGIRVATEKKPDLIICDICMPLLDGYGVLHMLQKREEAWSTPFIFLSAMSAKSEIRKGMELGADDYIVKPFDSLELLNAVEIRLKKSKKLRSAFSPDISGLRSLLTVANGTSLLEELREGRNTNTYKKKQLVWSMGNHPTYLYFIQKGRIKTSLHNDEGKEIITRVYGPGEFLGYKALLENKVYDDEAEAIEPAEVALIPRNDFESLAYSNMDVVRKFIQLLTANLSENQHHLLGMAYNSLRKRVADALLYLHHRCANEGGLATGLDIGRDNIAAIAGVAKESLIRTLGDFRDENSIEIRNGAIFIKDVRKLERMVN
ncbi:response regulator [Chitinophaga pollutisoli]|uniref:Response regulator n=1 Tax=Chitinophaga pollutisoli TaxID=3133966 RepID=A0ABZ2YM47_9BACT